MSDNVKFSLPKRIDIKKTLSPVLSDSTKVRNSKHLECLFKERPCETVSEYFAFRNMILINREEATTLC